MFKPHVHHEWLVHSSAINIDASNASRAPSHLAGKATSIRNFIERLWKNTYFKRELAGLANQFSHSLHPMVIITSVNKEGCLLKFLTYYLKQLPDCLEALIEVSLSAGIERYTNVFLNVAADFLIEDSERLNEPFDELSEATLALLHKAYLAHRVVEELNDRCTLYFGEPISPVDTGKANIIMHSLIGEEFANELDKVVHFTLSEMREFERSLLANVHPITPSALANAVAAWPCLSQDCYMDIDFVGL
ncbi:hypothetical protein [Marinibactrum halimedae]|nr:hypothetical protein [Marinibactrum halimedae]MCD9461044.1 hypothetical protein [Marinibactrum halimedae]